MSNVTARSLRASIFLVLLASLTLAACTAGAATAAENDRSPSPPASGGSQPGGGGSQPVEPDPDEPIGGTPGPVDPAPGDGATHVTPVPGIQDPIPHAVDRISVGADGRTVTVYWYGGVEDCYGLAEVRVERDADGTLVITVLEGPRPSDDGVERMCIEIALLKATTITLDEPLFVDGSQS
jgi:hypothetical protein